MFSLLLVKFLSLNYRTRLIVGFSIVTTFCLLIISVWFNSSSDRLARYLPSDTVTYLWLNQSKLQKNSAGIKIVDRVLIKNGVGEINKHLLSRQLAQVCLSPRGEINCGLLIEVIEPREMEKELQIIGVTYKKLSKKVFAISHDSLWLETINKKNRNFLAIRAQHLPWRDGEITLYLKAPNKALSQEAKTLSLVLRKKNSGVFLCGEASDSKLLLSNKCFWLMNLKPNTNTKHDVLADLIISLDNSTKLINDWKFFLKNKKFFDPIITQRLIQIFENHYSINGNSELWKKISSAKQTLIIKKKENDSNSFLKNYDISWNLEITDLSIDDLSELEKTLYALLAQEEPREAVVYLSDGTKVIELLPDESQIIKETNSDWVSVKTKNNFQLSYQYKNGILHLTNNIDQKQDIIKTDYFYLTKELFPNLDIFHLISDFQSISYQNNIIEIY